MAAKVETVKEIILRDTLPITLSIDSSSNAIHLSPVKGDNYMQLQAAINYQISTPGIEIFLSPGTYNYGHPLIFASKNQHGYSNIIPRLRGNVNAKNAAMGISILHPTYNDAPAIAIQQGKGGYIKDLQIIGNYTFSKNFSILQIDTTSNWNDGSCRFNQSSPYAGIAIDPFSDPVYYKGAYQMYPGLTSYYISGMSHSGSTAITFSGLSIQCFVVGFVITPSYQQNGEIIHLYHSQIQNCYTAYAICQAQSKQCEVKDFECWGGTHTVFDNLNWGIRKGDQGGSPMIDGVNIAGYVHQIFDICNLAFHGSFRNIFAETVFELGRIGGNAGASLEDCEIDFNADKITPSPECHIFATNTIFINDILRMYGSTNSRIALQGYNNIFIGGQQNAPPCWQGIIFNPIYTKPTFQGVFFYDINGALYDNNYDSLAWSVNTILHINRNNFSGWFITTNKATVGDLIITQKQSQKNKFYNWTFYNYPVGYVSRISRDTIFLQNTGVFIRDGEKMTVYEAQFKKFIK